MKKNHKKLALSSLVLALITSQSVLASNEGGVIVYQNYKERFEENQAQFSQTGITAEMPNIIKGYGKDVPFTISLDIIVPKHWDVSFNEGAENLLVNWQSASDGLAWPYVLEDLSKRNNVSVAIDWKRKNVNFYAHEAHNERFDYLAGRDESYVIDQAGEKIELERILREKEEYSRMNQMLMREANESRDALNENEQRIADLQEQMRAREKEEELALNYGSGLIMQSELDGDEVIIGFEQDVFTEGLNVSLEELEEEHRNRTVLPINDTFDFYRAGGWRQDIDFHTPATYIAKRGRTIKEVIDAWGAEIGWEVTYNTNVHYTIDFDMRFKGIAREAMIEFVSLYENSQRPVDIMFYPRQKLIVIEDLVFERRRF